MRHGWTIGAIAGLAVACTTPPVKPSVVIITWDTVRADRVGQMVAGRASTPTYDRLAADGVRFTGARTTAPVTLSAHASLMTGLHPPSHGARDNGRFVVRNDVGTLAEQFAAQGYATGAFVSASVLGVSSGIGRGFASFDDSAGQEIGRYRRGDETVDAALAWLGEQVDEQPVFLWVHLFDAHRPWLPSLENWTRHQGDAYQAEIAYTDAQTGRLLDAMGLRLQESIVVLTADHGESLGQHGEESHAFFAYDATMRIPMVWWWGERAGEVGHRGHTAAGPASLVDVAPTLNALLGGSGMRTEGRSLQAPLQGSDVAPRELPLEAVSGVYVMGSVPIFGVIDKEGHSWFDLPRRERYDLATDPKQVHNLYADGDSPTLDALMRGLPRQWPPAEPVEALDETTAHQLAALGYVSFEQGSAELGEVDPKDRADLIRFVMTSKIDLPLARAKTEGAQLQARYGWLPSLVEYLVEYYDGVGHSWEADAVVQAALAAHPGRSELSRRVAERAAAMAEKERLLALIQAAIVANPSNPDSHFDLGVTLRYLGRLEEAEGALREAVRLAPNDGAAQLKLAHVLRIQGKVGEAIGLLESQVVRDPAMRCELGRFQYVHGRTLDASADNLESCWAAGGRLLGEDLLFLKQQRFPD